VSAAGKLLLGECVVDVCDQALFRLVNIAVATLAAETGGSPVLSGGGFPVEKIGR